MALKCDHFWQYPHAVISGPTPTSLVVVRQCARCKRKEMAKVTAGMWTEAKGDYRRTEHYDIG